MTPEILAAHGNALPCQGAQGVGGTAEDEAATASVFICIPFETATALKSRHTPVAMLSGKMIFGEMMPNQG